jgi:DNA damage-binding protein 1
MVGLGDGSIITFTIDMNNTLLLNRRKNVLGTHPIHFTSFFNNNELCVFASCDRPTVIYHRNGKLLFSVLNLNNNNSSNSKKDVTSMAPFHTELFPNSLALVSASTTLMIGNIDDVQKLHVQTFKLGQSPRRIAYSSKCGVFAGFFFYLFYVFFFFSTDILISERSCFSRIIISMNNIDQ